MKTKEANPLKYLGLCQGSLQMAQLEISRVQSLVRDNELSAEDIDNLYEEVNQELQRADARLKFAINDARKLLCLKKK